MATANIGNIRPRPPRTGTGPNAKRPGFSPGVRVTKFAGPVPHHPPVDARGSNPSFSDPLLRTGPEPPFLGAYPALRMVATRQSRYVIHPIDGELNKAPSRRSMDFGAVLWLSCNKLNPRADPAAISGKDCSDFRQG